MPADPWLTTPRLILRRPTPADLDRLFAIHSDPETYRHLPNHAMTRLDQAAERLAEWSEHWETHGFGYAVVERAADHTTIGYTGLHHHELADRPVLNLYYRFDPASWGHGYATEAVEAILAWARVHQPDLSVTARVATTNAASLALAERVGLTRVDLVDPTDPVEHLIFSSAVGPITSGP